MTQSDDDRYSKAGADRQSHVEAVLQSKSRKKIVVAGPGTGKTFLFKAILRGKQNSLTLTFVNSLVEDLSLDLCGLSEVKTLHGFARSVMGKAIGGVRVFPKLSKVIAEDMEILNGSKVDFDTVFHTRDDNNQHLTFYRARKDLYGHYGFADIIYAAVLYLEQDARRIPAFDQVLVDEFQDFNTLEVSLIDLLASKSPTLIAGDDDQALYFFKNASPEYIRHRYSDGNREYESFNLPHCSRCTQAIVGAANDVVVAATKEGFLKGRIEKPFVFFEEKKKELECARYPKLMHVTCFTSQLPYFITKTLAEIAEERRESFTVLIIAPTKSRCRKIAGALKKKGFRNVNYVDQDANREPSLFDGLMLLLKDQKCNLGWRIAAKFVLSDGKLKELLAATSEDKPKSVFDALDDEPKKTIKSLLSTFRKVSKSESIDDEASARLLSDWLDMNPHGIAQEVLRTRMESIEVGDAERGTRNIPIRVTTIPSSKGLADDYVFIADFDDRFFLDKELGCTDQKIFDFLVALTRARRKVFLISSERRDPKFLGWIAEQRVERVEL